MTWNYYTVSLNSKLSIDNDSNLRKNLINKYKDSNITLDYSSGRGIIISDICSFEFYLDILKPFKYLGSKKELDKYNELLLQEGVILKDKINLLKPISLQEKCPKSFTKIIGNQEYLIIEEEHGYLLLFKKQESSYLRFWDEFPEYCKDLNDGQIFEGTHRYICSYPNKTLIEAYARVKNFIDDDASLVLKDALVSMQNVSYESNILGVGAKMHATYRWSTPKNLEIVLTLEGDSEITTYTFEEKKGVTTLTIITETGY